MENLFNKRKIVLFYIIEEIMVLFCFFVFYEKYNWNSFININSVLRYKTSSYEEEDIKAEKSKTGDCRGTGLGTQDKC